MLTYRKILLACFGAFIASGWGIDASAQIESPPEIANAGNIGDLFDGESLVVTVSVLGGLFDTAIIHIGFEKTEVGLYRAWMVTEAQGITKVFTRFLGNRYESRMVLSEDGKRLIPIDFTRVVVKTNETDQSRHTFDYKNGIRTNWRKKGGEVLTDETAAIPGGVIYENYLSAVYNFRAGVYGPIRYDSEQEIVGIPKESFETYKLKISGLEETEALFDDYDLENPGWLIHIDVPKELFNVDTGGVLLIMDANRVPLQGRALNVIGFTDVVGEIEIDKSRPKWLHPAGWVAPTSKENPTILPQPSIPAGDILIP